MFGAGPEAPAGDPAEAARRLLDEEIAGDRDSRSGTSDGFRAEDVADMPTADLLEVAIGVLNEIARDRGSVWAVEDRDVGKLARVWAPVIDKWLPDMDMGPEIVAIATTAIIFLPRRAAARAQRAHTTDATVQDSTVRDRPASRQEGVG